MIVPLLLAGLVFRTIAVEEPVLDVRVVDVDADGAEDIVAVTRKHLLLVRGGREPLLRRPVAPLTIVGKGLLGVVRDGRYRAVPDPFGEWKEGPPGRSSLLGRFGKGEPALADAPGDVDGDGRDDAVLAGEEGMWAGGRRLPVRPEAVLQIERNETFAIRYEIPVPVVGSWTGRPRELVFFAGGEIVSFAEGEETDRFRLPLTTNSEEAEGIRRNHVFLDDLDGDGRLDLIVVIAKGKAGLFSAFEATAMHFPGGRVYDHSRKKFHRPKSLLKVAGALLRPGLVDLDGDGDLDLVLSTIEVGILAGATGNAPGTYHMFRFSGGRFERKPAWTYRGPVPLSAFTENPQPPVVFLPDLDGDGRPEALVLGTPVRLRRPDDRGAFQDVAEFGFAAPGRPALGRRLAAVPGQDGILVVERGE